jgi:PadR family transcriptional regulator, regulatory protein AphA
VNLPTTTYAVLGMLAVRPWTGYELTQQLRRSLDYCWPKAASVLYDEQRRLVRHGLATATPDASGGRSRTRYEITEAGRAALRTWLASPPDDPKLELEVMLRLLYADQGEADDLLRSVEAFRDWAGARFTLGMSMFEEYLDTGGPFPHRAHLNSLFGLFFAELFEVVDRWTQVVTEEVRSWPTTRDVGMTANERRLVERAVARDRTAR